MNAQPRPPIHALPRPRISPPTPVRAGARRLVLALAAALAAPLAHAAPYQLVDLGVGYPFAADDRGDVAGWMPVSGSAWLKAARWHDGQMDLLDDLGTESRAEAIAPGAWAAGYALDAGGHPSVRRWAPDGSVVDLGVIGEAVSLNRAGTLVGYTLDDQNRQQGWQVAADGTFTWLPPLAGDVLAKGSAINRDGWIAGTSWAPDGHPHCVVWRDGVPRRLGLPAGASACVANGINDAGHVVGTVLNAAGATRGFLWRDGAWTILPTLGGLSSDAVAVNAADVVVGSAQDLPGHHRHHPYVWKDGAMTDLTQAFEHHHHIHLESVVGIDAWGRIVLLAQPVPSTESGHVVRLVPTGE